MGLSQSWGMGAGRNFFLFFCFCFEGELLLTKETEISCHVQIGAIHRNGKPLLSGDKAKL